MKLKIGMLVVRVCLISLLLCSCGQSADNHNCELHRTCSLFRYSLTGEYGIFVMHARIGSIFHAIGCILCTHAWPCSVLDYCLCCEELRSRLSGSAGRCQDDSINAHAVKQHVTRLLDFIRQS